MVIILGRFFQLYLGEMELEPFLVSLGSLHLLKQRIITPVQIYMNTAWNKDWQDGQERHGLTL